MGKDGSNHILFTRLFGEEEIMLELKLLSLTCLSYIIGFIFGYVAKTLTK